MSSTTAPSVPFEGAKWWGRFKMKLDIAQITTSPVQIVVWTAIGTFIAVYGLSLLAGPLAGLLGFVVPFIVRGDHQSEG